MGAKIRNLIKRSSRKFPSVEFLLGEDRNRERMKMLKIPVKIIYLIYFHCFFPADKSTGHLCVLCVVKRGEAVVINFIHSTLFLLLPPKKRSYKFQQSIDSIRLLNNIPFVPSLSLSPLLDITHTFWLTLCCAPSENYCFPPLLIATHM